MMGSPERDLPRLVVELPVLQRRLAEAEGWLSIARQRGCCVDELETAVRQRAAAVRTTERLIEITGRAVYGDLDEAGVLELKERLVDEVVPALARERTSIK